MRLKSRPDVIGRVRPNKEFSNLAEIVSAIAVVVTLVYLSTQIRQAKRHLELQGRQARADAARDALLAVSEGAHIPRLFAELDDFACGDHGLSSKEDNARFTAWCHAWMRTEEHNFRARPAAERATQDQRLPIGYASLAVMRATQQNSDPLYRAPKAPDGSADSHLVIPV